MTKKLQIYKCGVCGNMVEMVHDGVGELVCCNQPMKLFTENSTDAATEKHVPVIANIDNGYKVTVGSVPHPMEDKHYIEWIELISDGKAYRQFLKPGNKPETFFEGKTGKFTVREYCNVHGLWKSEG